MVRMVDIRMWSKLGQRGTFGLALKELASQNSKIVALSADLCNTSGLDRFQTEFSERFLNVGIAEQNMVGIAAGMADTGDIPFASTFANFASLRACEFIRHYLGYMQCNVKLVGLGAGFAMELFGTTHYGLEDIAALRAIPNLVILSPADGLETVKCVQASADIKAPVYLRLTGIANQPIVYNEDFNFSIGKANKIRAGKDIALIAAGSMVARALKAAEMLKDREIDCTVIDMHTLKPLDTMAVKECLKNKLIVTVEEHSTVGGLGSAVAEVIAESNNKTPLLRIGTGPAYLKAGTYEYMLQQHGLTAEQIAEKIIIKLKEVS